MEYSLQLNTFLTKKIKSLDKRIRVSRNQLLKREKILHKLPGKFKKKICLGMCNLRTFVWIAKLNQDSRNFPEMTRHNLRKTRNFRKKKTWFIPHINVLVSDGWDYSKHPRRAPKKRLNRYSRHYRCRGLYLGYYALEQLPSFQTNNAKYRTSFFKSKKFLTDILRDAKKLWSLIRF